MQTLRDFELIVVSEHMTSNETIAMIESYSDDRLRHIHNTRRLGIAQSANVGLKQARGEYIARMDSDDLSMPRRLERQVTFLDAHPDVGVVGSWFETIDESGAVISRHSFPAGPALTGWMLFFGNVIAHSSVMVRRVVYDRLCGYRQEWPYVEDYDCWVRAARITRIVNLPDVLLRVRLHQESVSSVHRQVQMENAVRVSKNAIADALGRDVSLSVVHALMKPQTLCNAQETLEAGMVIHDLCVAYVDQKAVSKEERASIRLDAANRLYWLAKACIRKNPLVSAAICGLIIRLCPRQSFWFVVSYPKRMLLKPASEGPSG
jgi:hypothetical protein